MRLFEIINQFATQNLLRKTHTQSEKIANLAENVPARVEFTELQNVRFVYLLSFTDMSALLENRDKVY